MYVGPCNIAMYFNKRVIASSELCRCQQRNLIFIGFV
jgi:hypothetical protein